MSSFIHIYGKSTFYVPGPRNFTVHLRDRVTWHLADFASQALAIWESNENRYLYSIQVEQRCQRHEIYVISHVISCRWQHCLTYIVHVGFWRCDENKKYGCHYFSWIMEIKKSMQTPIYSTIPIPGRLRFPRFETTPNSSSRERWGVNGGRGGGLCSQSIDVSSEKLRFAKLGCSILKDFFLVTLTFCSSSLGWISLRRVCLHCARNRVLVSFIGTLLFSLFH